MPDFCDFHGWIDPGSDWQFRRVGEFTLEADGVGLVGGTERVSAFQGERCGAAVVDRLGGHVADTRVAVDAVVPRKERLAVGACVFKGAEAFGKVGTVFQGLEVCFGIRIVVGHVRPAMGFGDVEVEQQGGDGFGAHAGAAVGVQGECAGGDMVFGHRLSDQLLGEFAGFARRDHPTDDVAAEDVEDHVEVEAGPLRRASEFGDIPTPDLLGPRRQQFGLDVAGVNGLTAPLAGLAAGFKQAVHGAHRTHIDTVVQ